MVAHKKNTRTFTVGLTPLRTGARHVVSGKLVSTLRGSRVLNFGYIDLLSWQLVCWAAGRGDDEII